MRKNIRLFTLTSMLMSLCITASAQHEFVDLVLSLLQAILK